MQNCLLMMILIDKSTNMNVNKWSNGILFFKTANIYRLF
jgi:hypothetical protein